MAEGGISEAVAGDVSHAEAAVTMLDGCIAAFGRVGGVKAREGSVKASDRSKRLKLADGEGVKAKT